MTDKIKTCKPSLISSRADFNYKFAYTDNTGAEWEFDLHTLSAKQRGAIQSSYAVVKLDNEGKAKTEIEGNMELIATVTIYNALSTWNLDETITIDNIDLLPKNVRNALTTAISDHESENDLSLESEIKN